jgi:hypothetical protein
MIATRNMTKEKKSNGTREVKQARRGTSINSTSTTGEVERACIGTSAIRGTEWTRQLFLWLSSLMGWILWLIRVIVEWIWTIIKLMCKCFKTGWFYMIMFGLSINVKYFVIAIRCIISHMSEWLIVIYDIYYCDSRGSSYSSIVECRQGLVYKNLQSINSKVYYNFGGNLGKVFEDIDNTAIENLVSSFAQAFITQLRR